MAFSVPMVILVDAATAATAELFAGCLSAHGRALVLGGPTYGKQTAYRFAADTEGKS
jgi:carboxyl-terminal processing protease